MGAASGPKVRFGAAWRVLPRNWGRLPTVSVLETGRADPFALLAVILAVPGRRIRTRLPDTRATRELLLSKRIPGAQRAFKLRGGSPSATRGRASKRIAAWAKAGASRQAAMRKWIDFIKKPKVDSLSPTSGAFVKQEQIQCP